MSTVTAGSPSTSSGFSGALAAMRKLQSAAAAGSFLAHVHLQDNCSQIIEAMEKGKEALFVDNVAFLFRKPTTEKGIVKGATEAQGSARPRNRAVDCHHKSTPLN